jgi:hypothetical protein
MSASQSLPFLSGQMRRLLLPPPSSGKASQTLEPLLSRMKDASLRFPTQLDPVFHPLLSFRSLEE